MRSLLCAAALACITLLLPEQKASANLIYNLSGVTLQGGGTLTGGFTTNDARTVLLTYDIIASANGAFPGFEFTPLTSTATAPGFLPSFFQLDSPGSAFELRLIFSGGLTANGATITTGSSYEFEASGGPRSVTAGSVIPAATVPDSGTSLTLLLMSAGLLLLVASCGRYSAFRLQGSSNL